MSTQPVVLISHLLPTLPPKDEGEGCVHGSPSPRNDWYNLLRYTSLIHSLTAPNPKEQEMDHATELYNQAFFEDSYMKAIVGGNWSLARLQRRSVLRAALLEGEVYAVKDTDSDRIISMGICFAPGRTLFGTEAQRSLGYDDWIKNLSPEALHWNTHTVPELKKREVDPMFTKEEMKRRWWCYALFTDIDHRGKGCAKAIMNEVTRRASQADGTLGLLTTLPINVVKYKAMGFQERGMYTVPTSFGDLKAYVLTRKNGTPGFA